MLARVREFVKAHNLLDTGDRVGVAVSGGVDSVVLLHVLRVLAELGLSLTVCHLDHGLRPESGRDADFVRDLAAGYGLPFVLARLEVRSYARTRHLSLEMAARELRYAELRRMADHWRLDRVALGHHLDDQVETILLRVLRGTGLEGLSGMEPRRSGGFFVRPLLAVGRAEILAYAKENALTWVEDASNRETEILRNRVRHELLPVLRAGYNQRVDRALLGLSALASEALAHLERELTASWPDLAVVEAPGGVTFSAANLTGMDPVLGRVALRRLFAMAGGDPGRLSQAATGRMWDFARGTGGARLSVPGGFAIQRRGDGLYLGRVSRPAALDERPVPVPGALDLGDGRSVTAEWWLGNLPDWSNVATNEAFLDGNVPVWPLLVRSRRPGDRFFPLGLGAAKKVKEVLAEARVPREERSAAPIIVDGTGRIVWLAGLRLDHRFRVTGETRRVLHLVLRRASSRAADRGDPRA